MSAASTYHPYNIQGFAMHPSFNRGACGMTRSGAEQHDHLARALPLVAPIRNAHPAVRAACVTAAAMLALCSWTGAVPAQQEDDPERRFVPPIAGTWDPVRSLGQPRRWESTLTLGFGLDPSQNPHAAGITGGVGVSRSLFNPVTGALSLSTEAYFGQRGTRLDGGARLNLESPAIFLRGGLDWNARLRRTDLAFALTFPVRRGGWPVPGGELRVEWIPARQHAFGIGAVLPLNQPLAGRTRPRRVEVPLPRRPRQAVPPSLPADSRVRDALREVAVPMRALVGMQKFFWLIQEGSVGYEATVREWRQVLATVRAALVAPRELQPGESAYKRELEGYHAALDRAFALAADTGPAAQEYGRVLADTARWLVLREVVFPYNRLIGQYRAPDTLDGLIARARAQYGAWLRLHAAVDPERVPEVFAVLDGWLLILQQLRADVAALAGDPRMNWLPLGLVLRPDQHRTQSQLDNLLALALGRGFEPGNATLLVNALQFQRELERTIHETQHYHVLWVHDFRGRDADGQPDQTGFETTRTYLRALRNGVQAYERTGQFPVYLIVLDQFFYEVTHGRRWLTLLERPLRHRVRLPDEHGWMEESLLALQDSLRAAVAESRRLRADIRAFGSGWVDQLVKVHVNITNPSDLTFRSRRILMPPPLGADNLLRDHRKLVIRDVFEDQPGAGEVILAGVAVGDHYASPTWEDRALIIQGPGAQEARNQLRAVLARHRLGGAALPAPLRARPRAPDHAQQIFELELAGATARVLQVHNRTGWGDKEATFVQMLLYDLAPAGTLIYIPDSLWTSYQWMAQLVGAALRGCHVYVVAPALPNAPSADFPQMAIMQDLITRATLVEEALGDVIREGGGDLRVGLFTREAPLDDLPRLLAELEQTFDQNVFLQELFAFSPEARDALRLAAERLAVGSRAGSPSRSTEERPPQLHRKTQWIVSADVVRALAGAAAMPALVERALARVAEGVVQVPESGPVPHQARAATTHEILQLSEETEIDTQAAILYFMTGSVNKNTRSLALDGESLGVVAGPWALQAFFDFVLLSGGVTWVRELEDVEAHLPPYPALQRRIGRWLHRVI